MPEREETAGAVYVKESIRECLERNGYKEKLDKVFGTGNHGCGMPGGIRVWVQPNYTPIDGAHVLLVTPTTVESWVLPYPTNYHDWYRRTSMNYGTPEEMMKHVEYLSNQPRGCW